MIPSVSIGLANGAIGGAIATGDNVVGHVMTGKGVVPYLTPLKINSLVDAVAQGITQTDEPDAYRFVKEFYDIDGTLNVPFYLMLTVNTASLVTICDKTNANGLLKLIKFSDNTIRVLGVERTPAEGYEPITESFIDSDVLLAMPNAKALQLEQFAKHCPLRIVLAARINDEANPTIFVPNKAENNAVALAIGGTRNNGSVSMGLILGRIAATPVHRNIGRVKDGALPVNTMYIGTKKIEDFAGLPSLIDGGYITFTKYAQKAGYFISDDPMATAETDDYRSVANCRVIDKASIIAYQTYLEELKDDVDLDATGRIAPLDLKYLEGVIVNNISLAMSDNISRDDNGRPLVKVVIDPVQSLLNNSKLKAKLRVAPKGYLKLIEVELGFYDPSKS